MILASNIAAIARFVEATPAADRAQAVAAAAPPHVQIAIGDKPPVDHSDDEADVVRLRQVIAAELGITASSPTLLVAETGGDAAGGDGADTAARAVSGNRRSSGGLAIATKLSDGHWLVFTLPGYVSRRLQPLAVAAVMSPLLIMVVLLSWFVAQRLAAPIKDFAAAAERLGVDSAAPPLKERGPHELRVAIRAFNTMQQRLKRFVEDRTQMLAAMSHDLRTPLHRLRLRAEFMENEDQQRKALADLEAMNGMIDATLAFARDDAKREPRQLVDLAVLIQDLCDDAADAGAPVSYAGPFVANICCRPGAVGRAVSNLIDNAVKYGGAARVSVTQELDCFCVTVDDDGAGIPLAEQEKVFAPFYRLEPSRSRDTGGVGLGLSVARTIAREHGGEVRLNNRADGGLRARLELPIANFDLSPA